jgi:hypothetical protein
VRVKFSIDLYDKDGDRCECGIFLHLNDSTIIRFVNLIEFRDFQRKLEDMTGEITDAYVGSGAALNGKSRG